MFCPECGTENSNEATFCKNCGGKLDNPPQTSVGTSRRCPYCAEEINPDAIKCKHCGEWLDKKSQPKKDSNDYSAAILLGVIFTIFGGIIGFIIGLYLATRDDERTKNIGVVLIIVNIVWILLLILWYASWMNSMNSYYYYY